MIFKRCTKCLIPNTRPDTHFNEEGVCSACTSYAARQHIDWSTRKAALEFLLEEQPYNGSGYDCIVPSSGGKDSTAQVLKLIELGARPLVVTATTCHLTEIGRANIDNLARFATTIEVSPNKEVRKKLNRLGLTMVGDISYPEHVSIFTTPFKMALKLGIPLIMYGENPQQEYGGPPGSELAREMTRRWVAEFGGFLGLRPDDLIGAQLDAWITKEEMQDYQPPDARDISSHHVQAHFLGHYLPWDSKENARIATEHGMRAIMPTPANWWVAENQDNAQTGLHDHMMYRKYGYGRGCAQISVDIRAGRVSRETALQWVKTHDGLFPWVYMGINWANMLDRIGFNPELIWTLMDKFTNWDIFTRDHVDDTTVRLLHDE